MAAIWYRLQSGYAVRHNFAIRAGLASPMVDSATFDGMSVANARTAGVLEKRARAFDEAMRHSRRVRFLRKAIPITIVGTLTLMLVARVYNPFRSSIPDVQVSSVGVSGSKLTMEMPKLSGFKKDNKAYEMTASAASQDIKSPSIVELTEPTARIEMQKGSWVRLTAAKGLYDTVTEKLHVNEKVTVRSDSGLDMRLREAKVDFKTGNMATDQPVEVDMPDGWVRSERMNVTENGKIIIFEGRVRSEFKAAQQDASAAETSKQ